MDDTILNISINAITDGFDAGIAKVNKALEFDHIPRDAASTPVGQLFATMQRSSDFAIVALIRGVESWHQASVRIITDLEIRFAQLFANKLLHETVANGLGLVDTLKTDAGKLASNVAKNNAIVTNDGDSAAVVSASHASQLLKQIGSDAAAAYAGVFANMSPVLGPAAAIPAGVAYASVAAMEGLVSLDVGAWNLGSDMVAQLHRGEMVVPQNFAEGLRSGSGLGGDNYTINIHAIDTQTGTQFLKNNAAAIASALSSQARNFNRNVPSWKN